MLCLIRHGETTANQRRLYAGVTEYELTPNGLNQAARIGKIIVEELAENFSIDRQIISSPIGRARQTARIISDYIPEAELAIDDRIREVDYGHLDGTPIRKGISFINEAQQPQGGQHQVEPIASIRQRAYGFLTDNEEYLDPSSLKVKLAIGHGALWSVTSALAQMSPLSDVKIQKNYEVLFLTKGGVETIDTREIGNRI